MNPRPLRLFAALSIGSTTAAQTALPPAAVSRGIAVPRFVVDTSWPKRLPNGWAIGQAAGIAVDSHGQITAVPAGTGTAAALTRILLIAAEAATLGTWTRLKACSADHCQWAFYDRSPARTGCWCSMQICGARSKSRAYRRRAAAQAKQQTSPAAGHHSA